MADLKKLFLDYEGLTLYDELIKSYVKTLNDNGGEATKEVLDKLISYQEENDARVQEAEDAIALLNGDKDTEGSVAHMVDTVVGEATEKAVDDAIKALVDNAPEALDTLKEIADWIAEDETGTAALIERVSDIEDAAEALAAKEEQDIADLKDYVDAQDDYYWNHIGSIDNMKVAALFAVEQKAGETAAAAIAANSAVKLGADQVIAEDIVITGDKYIDANGATFEGQVTVPAGANVVIENATFAKPVIVA